MKKTLHFLLYSNLWISLATPALMAVTGMDSGMEMNKDLLGLGLFGVLLSYNFQRGIRSWRGTYLLNESNKERKKRNLFYVWMIMIGGLGLALFFFRLSNWQLLWILLPVGIISFFYAFNLFGKSSKRAFRDLPFLKIFLIALSWAVMTVSLPHFQAKGTAGITSISHCWLWLERFLFVFALTIPFDIRDLPFDDPKKRTVPQLAGINAAKDLALGLMAIFLLSCWIRFGIGEGSIATTVGLSLSALISGILIKRVNEQTKEPYFSGWLDGMMIGQFVLVWGARGLF